MAAKEELRQWLLKRSRDRNFAAQKSAGGGFRKI
jgi:hypothetical protein